MKIISEEQEDADDFGNTNHLRLNHHNDDVGAATAGNCNASAGEGRKAAAAAAAAAAASATSKTASNLRYRDGGVGTDDAVGAVNGGGSLPVTVRKKKKKKATRTTTLDGSCSSEKQRFQFQDKR